MTESLLKAILRLYALVAQLNPLVTVVSTRTIVESYLRQLVSPEQVRSYLIIYDFYHRSYKEGRDKISKKLLSVFSVKSLLICEQINEVIEQKQKALVLLNLFDLVNLNADLNTDIVDFIRTVSNALHFDNETFDNSKAFILNKLEDVSNKNNVLIAKDIHDEEYIEVPVLSKDFLKGQIDFLYLECVKTVIFRYIGNEEQLYLNGRDIIPYRTYVLEKGASIRSPKLSPIYYSDISSSFVLKEDENQVIFSAKNVRFQFPESENGIYPFNFNEKSGRLVGIMGGSGVGKSTLLNVFNGSLIPSEGQIYINGYDIHQEKELVKGLIGFIPQDDLLIEELTVFQNLYYNAKLCFDNISDGELIEMVNKVLQDLDLYEVRKLKVGNPLNKFISGGQRKRLNIALELIREPAVLFVDEPTSGLSSHDSDRVMDLLKEQTRLGKLVIVNIHQPSSDIFKMFDKLLVLDKGGRFIYQGNPIDAVTYFKKQNNLINANESECLSCGNVNPEQVLQIIESTEIDEFGKKTNKRIHTPEKWYDIYKNLIEPKIKVSDEKYVLPKSKFSIPGKIAQFTIFSIRNLRSKLTDKQYMLINLLEAPLLAVILGIFTRYNAGNEVNSKAYIFSANENLPVYLFMAVVVSLFLGLMVSAEEIIRDRKILKREAFLNLSRFSYLNSKVALLVTLSAIQSISFVIVGSLILEIKGMVFHHWLILFASSVFSNMLGLNISATFRSVVAIYILIPLLLVPQILLGGAMLKFDKLNKGLTSQKHVPLVGDFMASRWAYEAISVHQFKYNEYQQYFYDIDKEESNISFKVNYLIPEMQSMLTVCKKSIQSEKYIPKTEDYLETIQNTLNYYLPYFKYTSQINSEAFDLIVAENTEKYLRDARAYYSQKLKKVVSDKDSLIQAVNASLDGMSLLNLKLNNHNERLENFMLNKDEQNKIITYKNMLIQKAEPIYLDPYLNNGRAHFYSPVKKLGGFTIETYWFNFMILMLMSIFFYVLLIIDGLNKINLSLLKLNFRSLLRYKKQLFKSSKEFITDKFGFRD